MFTMLSLLHSIVRAVAAASVFFGLALSATMPAAAESISRSYSYFSISGKTLADIEQQLRAHGPKLDSTGSRHPGATRLKFSTRIDYAKTRRGCRIAGANVSVKADVTLPRWRDRRRADMETALIWDTLSRDIKRHEESHTGIAKVHARRIEDTLKAMPPRKTCTIMAEVAQAAIDRILAEHDAAQAEFDRIESINFESRIMRLLTYRLQQMEEERHR